MADQILGVFYLTASQQGTEIPLPKWTASSHLYYPNYSHEWFHADSISFQFTSYHSGTMELVKSSSSGLQTVYGTSEPAGFQIDTATNTTVGPFRLIADPPRHIYSSKLSGEPCRVTVILIR